MIVDGVETVLRLQVNDAGNVLMDVWVRPKEKVTDFRFHVTGIHWSDLKDGISAEEASRRMHELTSNCILVGHALHNDIQVLPPLCSYMISLFGHTRNVKRYP